MAKASENQGPGLPGRQREARANDSAVLAAAREVFAAAGAGASMADVAKRAGVGVGSIYRRYATKEALVEALRLHAMSAAAALADEVSAHPPAAGEDPVRSSAVGVFLARHIAEADGPLLQPQGSQGGVMTDAVVEASEDLHHALDALVRIDREREAIPDGFTAADVMQLLLHLRPALPLEPARARAMHERYLALAMAGLRADADHRVSLAPGPRWDEWVAAWRG